MELREVLEKRRSVSDFDDREVSLDTIKEIIRDSIKAPSASNL